MVRLAVQRSGLAALAVAALIAVGGVLVSTGRIENAMSEQWTAFTSLGVTPGDPSARLASGAGTRYDYWRVALRQSPPCGHCSASGAGNYDPPLLPDPSPPARTSASRTRSSCRRCRSWASWAAPSWPAFLVVSLAMGAWRMRTGGRRIRRPAPHADGRCCRRGERMARAHERGLDPPHARRHRYRPGDGRRPSAAWAEPARTGRAGDLPRRV